MTDDQLAAVALGTAVPQILEWVVLVAPACLGFGAAKKRSKGITVTVIKTLDEDARYWDSDTGELEVPSKRQSEPIRILPAEIDKKPVTDKDLFEKLEAREPGTREPIPEDVVSFVWRRDEQCCVKCGNQERLELDHIIPLSKGGSNTARNIQLLCERCNREKGDRV
jgi:hypothetical protein